jgi:hypothetical protein
MSPLAARALIVLILLTWTLGRGLSETLPGSLTGFDSAIGSLLYAGAFLSQFLAISGSATNLRLASEALIEQGPGAWHRVLTMVLTACLAFGVLFSCLPRRLNQGPELLWLLGALACCLLVSSGVLALRKVEQRGPGLVILAVAFGAIIRMFANGLSWLGSDDADTQLFHWSNVLGLGADAWQVISLSLAFTWLLLRQNVAPKAVAAVFLATAPALTWRPSIDGPAAVFRATLDRLGSAPSPWTPGGFTAAIQLLTLGAGVIALVSPRHRSFQAIAIALALLGSASPDVPLGALVLNLAALLLIQGGAQNTTSPPRVEDGLSPTREL